MTMPPPFPPQPPHGQPHIPQQLPQVYLPAPMHQSPYMPAPSGYMQPIYDPWAVKQFHKNTASRKNINILFGISMLMLVFVVPFSGLGGFLVTAVLFFPLIIVWIIAYAMSTTPVPPQPIGYQQFQPPTY